MMGWGDGWPWRWQCGDGDGDGDGIGNVDSVGECKGDGDGKVLTLCLPRVRGDVKPVVMLCLDGFLRQERWCASAAFSSRNAH